MKTNDEAAREAIEADFAKAKEILFMTHGATPENIVQLATMMRDERWVREGWKL